ncbi:hypothetical protein [Microbacterium sp. ABRD28]|uniref:hypothetical protein n=1 Tax=Microbacterium sp. ABRD28 TaxID=2268461 RepID=UPI000F54F2B2|nr:hypothetical protein [Microbacterium sp. ABRD28]
MNLGAKITTGVAVLVVGGLVALAAPAVTAVHAEMSSWAIVAGAEEPTSYRAGPASNQVDTTGEEMAGQVDTGDLDVLRQMFA